MTEFQFADELQRSLEKHNTERLAGEYWRQDEFLYVQSFLPPIILSVLQQEIPHLQNFTHRANILRIRKGGGVGATNLKKQTTFIKEIYSSNALMRFLSAIVKRPLLACPEDDEHAMALYSYTEEGDFVHY
ncbi:MAG TPA: hypothetical protein VJ044_01770, partial [Candidatus Hodarchaeales archaeon]|nr:hypothetical protein [Candidatus Hodarchaeales archaeon]